MALTSWKAFNFFTASQVKPPEETESTSAIFTGSGVSSIISGSDNLFVGDYSGQIGILNSAFKQVRSFPANDHGKPVTKLLQFEGTSYLLSISEDLRSDPELKIWALNETEKKTEMPRCLSTVRVKNARKVFPVSAVAAMPDLSLVAVGFADGSIALIKGNLVHDLGAHQRIVYTSPEPITNLAFAIPKELSKTSQVTLFISTTERILALIAAGKGHGGKPKTLDDHGCNVGCMAPLHAKDNGGSLGAMGGEDEDGVVVVRDDAIYYYSTMGRGGCYAHEGPKQFVHIFRDYICLVEPPSPPSTGSEGKVAGAFKRLLGSSATADGVFEVTKLTILDTELKFVACQETVAGGVTSLFSEWGDLYLLTTDGKLHRYHEKELGQKLEILFQRNIFQLAISLAEQSGVRGAKLKFIYQKYADYLYERSEWDNAMQWYIKSICEESANEVSGVIRKFLDTQRIGNLIEFLEELHRQHLAGPEHTTLLLNCYAKTRDVEKLDRFIKESLGKGVGGDASTGTLDVETAISMCRQAGYFEQAVYLAERAGEDEIVVGLLGEELGRWETALRYLCRLEPDKAVSNLMKYAKAMLESIPKETTDFFVEFYSGRYRPRKAIVQEVKPSGKTEQTSGHQTQLSVTGMITGLGEGITTYTSFLTTQLPFITVGGSSTRTEEQAPVKVSFEPGDYVPYIPPKPRSAFSSFVDQPHEFITFLEALLEKGQDSNGELAENDKIDIYTTLFEMYLLRSAESRRDGDSVAQRNWELKAKDIIQSRENLMDTSNVLLLSHLSNFRSGTVLVREKQGLYFDIFRSCTSAKDTAGALEALRSYGAQEPQLYPAALSYLTSSPDILEAAGEEEFKRILQVIDEQGLMKPLQVVQTLSTNGLATVGMIKDYLKENIEKEQAEIRKNRTMIESHRNEIEQRRAEMNTLKSEPVDFKRRHCSSCGGNLELPVVHFLCQHSYHQRCLNTPSESADEKPECPRCANANKTIRVVRQQQDDLSDKHELFIEDLKDSKDGLATVSEFIGRGVMSGPAVSGVL